MHMFQPSEDESEKLLLKTSPKASDAKAQQVNFRVHLVQIFFL